MSYDNGWISMDEAPRDGTEILVARNNGCGWDYYTVWRSLDRAYPWTSDNNSYPEDYFSAWKPIGGPPYEIHF
ncbi:hypothetical protein EVB55_036 [Rhizobium phage RHph_Y68]|uniref:DUF551 domain-containing protein n=1 Tax=Rhizobium phage RHph_Y68 TaxID=2509787 RepID=A0A7S5UT61_9CAUD|nr:hypothetical protein PP934_gp036 [Rhizobium phage RHph_Y68]QIG67971.1 hypothetical protein EVB55_036 [Rhizobium phage RHph_Y68]